MSDRFDISHAYDILGLKPGASPAQIKQAYRRMVKVWHPDNFIDLQQKQEAEDKFKLINEAYNKLKSYQPPDINQSSQSHKTKVSPNRYSAETFYNLGVENAKLGRYEEALADFHRAIRLNPNYIQAYKYRGFICSQLGYEHRANSDLNKAAELEWKLKNKNPVYKSPKYASKSQSFMQVLCQKIKRFFRLRWLFR